MPSTCNKLMILCSTSFYPAGPAQDDLYYSNTSASVCFEIFVIDAPSLCMPSLRDCYHHGFMIHHYLPRTI